VADLLLRGGGDGECDLRRGPPDLPLAVPDLALLRERLLEGDDDLPLRDLDLAILHSIQHTVYAPEASQELHNNRFEKIFN
jgi:hypothetical protein